MTYAVVEQAGTDSERVVYECVEVGQAHDYVSYYNASEREELGIDVMRKLIDGTLTTEL